MKTTETLAEGLSAEAQQLVALIEALSPQDQLFISEYLQNRVRSKAGWQAYIHDVRSKTKGLPSDYQFNREELNARR